MGARRVTSVPYYIPVTLKQAPLPVIFGCPMGARRVTSVPYIPDAETSHSLPVIFGCPMGARRVTLLYTSRVTSVPYYIPDAETSHSACNIRLSRAEWERAESPLSPTIYQTLKQAPLPVIFGCPMGARRVTSVPIYQTLKQATLPVIFGCPMGARRVTSVPYYIPDAETSHSACNIRLSNGSVPSHLCPLLYTRRWNKPLCL